MLDPKTALAVLHHALANRAQAKQFVVEGAKWLAAGAPLATPEVLAQRKAICGGCDRWQPIAPGSTVMHCAACKCLAAKLTLSTSRCPLGKWLA